MTSHNYAKREMGEKEAEVGKSATNASNPCPNNRTSPHPSPNLKCQDNAEKKNGKKEENEVGKETSKTRDSRLSPPPNLTLKFKTQRPKIKKKSLKYLLKRAKKNRYETKKSDIKVQDKRLTHQDDSLEE